MQLLSVNYHYIRETKPKNGIYPVTLNEFERQLDDLGANYDFISQNDLSEMIKNNSYKNNKYCLITFDDGLQEQMEAFDLMQKKGIPGVFYVTTDPIINHKCVDVHKVHYVRSILDDDEMYTQLKENFDIANYQFDPEILHKQYRYDNELAQKVKFYINFILDKNQRDSFIDMIFNKLVSDPSLFAKKLYMKDEEIKKIYKAGMLGTHSASHRPLATLNNDDIRQDIESSLNYFQSLGINKIQSISYPYGSMAAVNQNVAKISKDFGFEFGITMYRGVNDQDYIYSNPLLLKRVSCSDIHDGKVEL